ncbi:MAG: hypothetical protein IJH48_07875 [Oscillospiraceae bacterium]|nr:hypothetical protein [Oscillospiraceae bacterium]
MTVGEILSLVELKEPNACTQEEKLRWLADLDGKIFRETVLAHAHAPGDESFTPPAAAGDELLVPPPWGEDVYVHYLIARIASANAETARYNQQIALYNAAYSQYWNAFNASAAPLHAAGGFRF